MTSAVSLDEEFFQAGQTYTIEVRDEEGGPVAEGDARARFSARWFDWVAQTSKAALVGAVLGISMGLPVWAVPGQGEDGGRVHIDLGPDTGHVHGIVSTMLPASGPRNSAGSELFISNQPITGVNNFLPKALTWKKDDSGTSVCEVSLKGMDELTTWLLQSSPILDARGDAARSDIKSMILMHEIAHCEMGEMAAADSGKPINQDFVGRLDGLLSGLSYEVGPRDAAAVAPWAPEDIQKIAHALVAAHGLEMQADIRAILQVAWTSLSGARTLVDVEEGIEIFQGMVLALDELRRIDHAGPNDVNVYLTRPAIEALTAYVVREYRQGRGELLERELSDPALAGRKSIELALGAMPTTLPSVLDQAGPAMSTALGQVIHVHLDERREWSSAPGRNLYLKMQQAAEAARPAGRVEQGERVVME